MIRLAFVCLICILVASSFVDTYSNGGYDNYKQTRYENLISRLAKRLSHYREIHRRDIEDVENWTGRWMPDRPGDPTPPPKVWPKHHENEYEYESVMESSHGIHHGRVWEQCDDGKTNLSIDWDHSPSEYTCYGHKITPNNTKALIYCETIPKAYRANHVCMKEAIDYIDAIPLYGPHRPLWPVYGEYKYLPKQRWLHSLEHGAIVMLYHPCAHPLEVKRLRDLVNRCLWRHVITPYSYLDEERPLALLSWGCRLTMTHVDIKVVKYFIQQYALNGPEQIADDGQFEDGLQSRSRIVTDKRDSTLCPYM